MWILFQVSKADHMTATSLLIAMATTAPVLRHQLQSVSTSRKAWMCFNCHYYTLTPSWIWSPWDVLAVLLVFFPWCICNSHSPPQHIFFRSNSFCLHMHSPTLFLLSSSLPSLSFSSSSSALSMFYSLSLFPLSITWSPVFFMLIPPPLLSISILPFLFFSTFTPHFFSPSLPSFLFRRGKWNQIHSHLPISSSHAKSRDHPPFLSSLFFFANSLCFPVALPLPFHVSPSLHPLFPSLVQLVKEEIHGSGEKGGKAGREWERRSGAGWGEGSGVSALYCGGLGGLRYTPIFCSKYHGLPVHCDYKGKPICCSLHKLCMLVFVHFLCEVPQLYVRAWKKEALLSSLNY